MKKMTKTILVASLALVAGGAFATLRMEVVFICGKADPKMTVWTTGSWNLSPVQRIDKSMQMRGHKMSTDADEWFMNGKRIDLETMEPMED